MLEGGRWREERERERRKGVRSQMGRREGGGVKRSVGGRGMI